MDEIIIDEKTRKILEELTGIIMESRARIHTICTTLLNYNNLEGEFSLSSNCSALIRKPKNTPEQTADTGKQEGEKG
jgi:hypothetical protein